MEMISSHTQKDNFQNISLNSYDMKTQSFSNVLFSSEQNTKLEKI